MAAGHDAACIRAGSMTPLLEARALSRHYAVRTGGLLRRQTAALRAVDEVSLSHRAR